MVNAVEGILNFLIQVSVTELIYALNGLCKSLVKAAKKLLVGFKLHISKASRFIYYGNSYNGRKRGS